MEDRPKIPGRNGGTLLPFSSTVQPKSNGRPREVITSLLRQELESDGWAYMEGEVVDPETKKPTGQRATIKVKLTTAQAVAKRLLANASAGREKSISMVLERTEGKVPLHIDATSNGQQIGDAWSGLPPAKKAEILRIMNSENASSE